MNRIPKQIAIWSGLLLIVGLLTAFPAHCLAQQYKQLPVDPKFNGWYKVRLSQELKNVVQMLANPNLYDKTQFEYFFNNILIPQMTLPDNVVTERRASGSRPPTTTSTLPDIRKEIAALNGPQATSKQARDRMNYLIASGSWNIVKDNFHPVARYNAMLVINELNDSVTSNGAMPYTRALGAMTAAAKNAAFPEAVRVAGVTGMVRHAQYGNVTSEIPFLVSLANGTARPAQLSDTAYDWMRRRAVDALAHWYRRVPPTKGEAIALAQKILAEKVAVVEPADPAAKPAEGADQPPKPAEKSASVELRAEALKLLLAAKAPLPDGLDTAKLASDISMVGVDAVKRELAVSLQAGRPVSTEDGVMFYVALSQKALAALNTLSPTPKVDELQPLLKVVEDLKGTEITVKDQIRDDLTKAHAKVESLATGVPESSLLVTVAPVGGNAQKIPRAGLGLRADPAQYRPTCSAKSEDDGK